MSNTAFRRVSVRNCYESRACETTRRSKCHFQFFLAKMTLMYRLHDNVRDQVPDKNFLEGLRVEAVKVVPLSQCSNFKQAVSFLLGLSEN